MSGAGGVEYEVAIMGGGLAGLTLARQLKRAHAAARILVVERRRHPVPEAAFKVGESTVEVGSHYLSRVLGLTDHLAAGHLKKCGLRYFCGDGANRDIAARLEVGPGEFFEAPAFQLDRGRLENWLGAGNRDLGVDFADGCAVDGFELNGGGHTLTLASEGISRTVRTRWLIDAGGRAGLLRRRLDLGRPVGHVVNAAWFRIAAELDIDTWSTDRAWRARVRPGLRHLSTNHLLGPGYWVWLIPLASGSTSVGIVADPSLHPFCELDRFERALQWLRRHEPQCAAAVEEHSGALQDFRTLKRLARGCAQLFSADRWALTGEAGVFTDPLYSSGTDLIAMANGFIADLIRRDLAGEPIGARAAQYDGLFRQVFHGYMQVYEGAYPVMGNADAFPAKTIWDMAFYWSWLALICVQDRLCDLEFVGQAEPLVRRYVELAERTQALFRQWPPPDPAKRYHGFIDVRRMGFLSTLNAGFADTLDGPGLLARLAENLPVCQSLTAVLEECAGRTASPVPDAEAAPAATRDRCAEAAAELRRALAGVGG